MLFDFLKSNKFLAHHHTKSASEAEALEVVS